MGEMRSERDERIVATVSQLWSSYQRGEVSIELLARQLYGLSRSLEGDVDAAIRRALPALAREVDILWATSGPEAGDRRLADQMNRFLIEVGEDPVAALDRPKLVALLTQVRQGAMPLDAIRAEARRTWLAGLAPTDDALAHDALFMLVHAEGRELTGADVSALLDYLDTAPGSEAQGRERLYDYFIGRAETEPGADDQAWDTGELVLAMPSQRRMRRLLDATPETAWPELAERLCAPAVEAELFLVGLLEDLLYQHADAFIDRIEQLADGCPAARERIAGAHVGGVAPTPAFERFWALQGRLGRQAERPDA